ncbi:MULTISPECIES: NAD(P)/FAD-dependent oxidoreductase [Amycolatopsis]|uniref:Ferredoxin--NADP reductase n=2 Tax=Amycolatopsis TaxID=1813 RepID=A0A076N5U3_AMYME|nr:NAD(P)/FAD-dependent oxidoreductase [Amycolatopsis methanolica]AIJ26185.1 putative thioredoxin reductase [Amycolatopsis methanolica 239]
MSAPTRVDLLLVGAGPVGLFGAYYAGFRGLSVAVMDSLPQVGGQVSALYPQKNIYDIAGFPSVKGQELVDRLFRQAAPFDPLYLLGQQAERLEHRDGKVVVTSHEGVTVEAGAVVITAGVGSASPRPLPCGEQYLGRGLHYFVPDLDVFTGRDVVVVGGGDSAVDWALAAVEKAKSVRLVHRRQAFRAHEHSVAQLHASRCELLLDAQVSALHGDDRVTAVEVGTGEGPVVVPADVVVAALGFKLQLGPIASWGLELRDRSILVDATMATNLPQVYAAGDIATHDGKVKLIAVGFGEVATAVNNAAAVLQPEVGLAPGHSSDAPPAALERVQA